MKKIIGIFIVAIIYSFTFFMVNSYAVSLDTLEIQLNKTTVRPGEQVTIMINFGQYLGAGDFSVSYDDNLLEYVSTTNGSVNDTGDKVIISYYDATNPIDNIKISFRAKVGITTSNPTELTVTANNLTNSDASITFDDITTPIVKNLVVEPEYADYLLSLEQTGTLIKGQENEMSLSYTSTLGRYYEKARLIAEATTPTGATAKLLATDTSGLEYDIVQSGWGDAQGYPIGGQNFSQILNTRGVFSEIGDYTITLKLIDRENSDSIIAQKTFNLLVTELAQNSEPQTQENQPTAEEQTTQETIIVQESQPTTEVTQSIDVMNNTQSNKKLLKTGSDKTIFIVIFISSMVVAGMYLYYYKEK